MARRPHPMPKLSMSQPLLETRLKRYLLLKNKQRRHFVSYSWLSRILRIPLSAFIGFHNRCNSDFGGMGPVGYEYPKNHKNLARWSRVNALDYAPIRVIGNTWFERQRAREKGLPPPVGHRICVKDRPRVRGVINRVSLHK